MAKQKPKEAPTDDESDIDGCDVKVTKSTKDEELPKAEGGVS